MGELLGVSTIIPTHNRPTLLSSAIESALQQSFLQQEVIVVDDRSTDETAQMLCGKAYQT